MQEEGRVKKINELYHNIESDIYLERHPEIYNEEAAKWQELGEKYFNREKQLTVLDIGTGIGFVPSIIGKYLKKGDVLVCTDISQKMLDQAKLRLAGYHDLNVKYLKADALEVARLGIEADIITMNSVLHHLPDYENVLKSLEKLVKNDGLFIIMHERNQRFCRQQPLLMKTYQNLEQLNHFARRSIKKVLLFLGLYKRESGQTAAVVAFYSKVQSLLIKEGIADHKLSLEEINSIVDLHDPDEGGAGFDPFEIQQKYFKNYEISELFTNKHLGPWAKPSFVSKYLQILFAKYFPNSGAIFGLIMKKK